MVFASEAFDAKANLEAISKYNCTTLYGVPTMFHEVLREYDLNPTLYSKSYLKKGCVAGSLAPRKLMERLINDFGLSGMINCYGQTETSPLSTMQSVEDDFEKRVTTIGRALPDAEVKIIDSSNRVVDYNTPGELCTRGYLVMKNYFNDDKATKKTIDEDGWLHSGDLAQMDPEGYITIVGRIKDMIIRGGENVYPKEIEEFLMKMPNVDNI